MKTHLNYCKNCSGDLILSSTINLLKELLLGMLLCVSSLTGSVQTRNLGLLFFKNDNESSEDLND